MNKLFPNYVIDIEKGTVYSMKSKCFVGTKKNEDGYSDCNITDKYGDIYKHNHEVIMAESLGLPKREWKIDENGRRYVVDHIIPVSKGGTDSIKNLRLVSCKENCNNAITKQNQINAGKRRDLSCLRTEEAIAKSILGKQKPICQLTLEGDFIREWSSIKEASEEMKISKGDICNCCNGKRLHKGKWCKVNTCGGYKWMYKSDYEKMLTEQAC